VLAPALDAIRPSWQTIPSALRDALTARVGVVVQAVSPPGGFTPGLAARLLLSGGGRVFIKGLPAGHAFAASYRHEAGAAALIPAGVPAPVLRWHDEIAGWIVLAFDDAGGRHADLGPTGRDLPAVLDAITAVHVPAGGLPQSAARIAPWHHGWAVMAAAPPADLHPWAAAHLEALAGIERDWVPDSRGATLVHGDLRADNVLMTDGGAVLVDWAFAGCGAPWLDLAALVPQLILAGHTPCDAERCLARLPAWRSAPPLAVTSYAVACAGYWTRSSQLPAPADAPHLRGYQARAGRAAVEWAAWRWGACGDGHSRRAAGSRPSTGTGVNASP